MKITSVKTNVEGMEDIIPVLMPLDEIGSGDVRAYINGMEDVGIQFMILGDDIWLPLLTSLASEWGITLELVAEHLATLEYPYKLQSVADVTGVSRGTLFGSMYLLTNTEQKYGAGALANDYVRDQLYEKFGCNMIVLPTSKDEVLILPETQYSEEDLPELLNMLHMLQQNQAEDEYDPSWLADHIYYIDLENGGARTLV